MQLTNDDHFLSQCGPDMACKVVRLALEIYARVPVLPRPAFSNSDSCPGRDGDCRPDRNFEVCDHIQSYIMNVIDALKIMCQTALLRRISDHNYVVPLLRIYTRDDRMLFVDNVTNESTSLMEWCFASKPSSIEKIRVVSLTTV